MAEVVRVPIASEGPEEVTRVPIERYRRRRPKPLAERPLHLVQITDPHLGPWRCPGPSDRSHALEALRQLGMESLAQRNIQTLSGGERQRVAIAVLLSQAPRTLLLDEPVSHLDLAEQTRVLSLVRRLTQQGHGVVMSLHDVNQALAYCDHLLLLHRGHALCGPLGRIGTPRMFSRLFGQPLSVLDGPRGPVMVPT